MNSSEKPIPCQLCEQPTTMLRTQHCDRCWELKNRVELDLELTYKILAALKPKPQGLAAIKIASVKARHANEIALLEGMSSILDKVPESLHDKCHIYCGQLDFNNLTREESILIMSSLQAGKWVKSINPSQPVCIDYATTIDGWTVRLWAAAPPDSCRVVEVEETVPATTKTVSKLICAGDKGEQCKPEEQL